MLRGFQREGHVLAQIASGVLISSVCAHGKSYIQVISLSRASVTKQNIARQSSTGLLSVYTIAICASGDSILWSEETRESITPTLTLIPRTSTTVHTEGSIHAWTEYQRRCKHDKMLRFNIRSPATGFRPRPRHETQYFFSSAHTHQPCSSIHIRARCERSMSEAALSPATPSSQHCDRHRSHVCALAQRRQSIVWLTLRYFDCHTARIRPNGLATPERSMASR